MLDAYLWYCNLDCPLREALDELVLWLDDEWGLLLSAVAADPLLELPAWLSPSDRSTLGRIQYCLMSGDPVYPIP